MTPTMLDLATVYGPARTSSNTFWKVSSRYSGGRHRGADYREQNESKTASVVTDVVAILDGTVVHASPAPGGALGGTVVIRGRDADGDVVYESHSHAVPSVKVSDKVKSGQRLGRNASWSDAAKWTGRRVKLPFLPITWAGIHDHVVFSRYSDGAWNTSRKVLDPVPFIKRATAAQIASRIQNATEGDTMTHAILVDNKHYFTVGAEFITHHGTKEQADLVRQVTSVKDELHKLSSKDFISLIGGLGIPQSVLVIKGGIVQAGVLNPETGKHASNSVWSRNRQTVALLKAITTGK